MAEKLGELLDDLLVYEETGGDGAGDLQYRFMVGTLAIIKLRGVHRVMCEDSEALRKASAAAKARLDQSSLQLQNLLYERQHYEKEIIACRSFRSAFTDAQLELLPLGEFAAHEAVQAEGLAVEEPHQLMLNRLQHELAFRQETLQQLDPLKARRDALAADVAHRRAAVAGLDAEVVKLQAAAAKTRQQYGVPTAWLGDAGELATLLPLPLYILYTQFAAAAAAGGLPADVTVTGGGAAGVPEQMQGAMQRSPSAPAVAAGSALAAAPDSASPRFPLGVAVAVQPKPGGGAALVATFYYWPSLQLITVAGADAAQDDRLAALYDEGDSGAVTPAGAGAGVGAGAAGLPPGCGRPYVWAQRAAGMDVLPARLADPANGAVPAVGLAECIAAVQRSQHEGRAAAVLEKLVQCGGGGAT